MVAGKLPVVIVSINVDSLPTSAFMGALICRPLSATLFTVALTAGHVAIAAATEAAASVAVANADNGIMGRDQFFTVSPMIAIVSFGSLNIIICLCPIMSTLKRSVCYVQITYTSKYTEHVCDRLAVAQWLSAKRNIHLLLSPHLPMQKILL